MKLKTRRTWLLAAAPVAVLIAAAGYTVADRDDQPPAITRQDEIAAKSRQVMPFDLDRTTHRFTETATGGVQTVVADDPAETPQIKLIRDHLAEEAAGFREGDYGDPASIHGGDMPGLRELEEGHSRIDIRYTDLPAGAQITYATTDASLITALHSWFDAQVTDHGSHAEQG